MNADAKAVLLWSRRMGFCAGPQNEVFHACAEHRVHLETGDVSCFVVLKDEPVRGPVLTHPDDERCDFCREG